MTPTEYRAIATEYRKAGRDADAEVCEIQAQEAERLARYMKHGPIDDTEAEREPVRSRQQVTPSGTAWLLPGIEPAPIVKGEAAQQTLF